MHGDQGRRGGVRRLVSGWSAGDADFNRDGATDTRDLVEFLREWAASR